MQKNDAMLSPLSCSTSTVLSPSTRNLSKSQQHAGVHYTSTVKSHGKVLRHSPSQLPKSEQMRQFQPRAARAGAGSQDSCHSESLPCDINLATLSQPLK